ncbi:DnaJ domain-containing protein, partial [Jimgerdemannia flammicorona]
GTPLDVIKKTFKIRSLIYHPDKAPDDKRAEYMTIFVDISKAYKVLTDEDTRKNYEEYGHPDGKQAFSMGIALPKWVVEGSNAIWVRVNGFGCQIECARDFR